MYKHLIQKGLGFIALGLYKNKVIAAQVYLNTGLHSVYKYGASNKKGFDLSASYLLMWESIKYLKSSGIESISLGRTALDNLGLLQFKDGWGAKREEIVYSKVFYNRFKQKKRKNLPQVVRNVFRHLPIFVLKIIGQIAYRFVG